MGMEINPVLVGAYVTIARDVVVTIAAVITASIALYGLKIWKRDLVGKESYEAAKALVYQSHALSRASSKMRCPIYQHERKVFSKKDIENTTEGERWRISEAAAFRVRLKEYSDANLEFYEALLNFRVIAGSQVYLAFQPFQRALGEPMDKLYAYLNLLDDYAVSIVADSPDVKLLSGFIQKFDGEIDPLELAVREAREQGELFLLPYLHRKSIRK
ncbi:hypothetical protein HU733_21325 [Pseudomonas paralactis]|uniref:hypothetical protein n=1 Tax=Pseudomonas paralactis TaxID=1615673 RepID=UPI001646276D|nr:hypothetical protein [Pseudomonas paralactis]MBC3258046.1 hypothetical protein [Pseudomonas paralactis]